jgi:hypothetical protein
MSLLCTSKQRRKVFAMLNRSSAAMVAIAAIMAPSLAHAACKDSDRPPTPTNVKWFATSDTTIALQ